MRPVGPFFIIRHQTDLKTEVYRSEVYDKVKKGDSFILMELKETRPVVVADVMIEFYNRPKMMAKVGHISS